MVVAPPTFSMEEPTLLLFLTRGISQAEQAIEQWRATWHDSLLAREEGQAAPKREEGQAIE